MLALSSRMLLACLSCLAVSSGQNLVLIGGSLGDNAAIYEKMVELAGGPGVARIGLITAAGGDPADDADYYGQMFSQYGALETYWVPVYLGNEEANADPAVVEHVRRMTGFFFGGGDQGRIVQTLYNAGRVESPVLAAIREVYEAGGMAGGTSAGAAVMGKPVMIQGGMSYQALRYGAYPVGEESGIDDLTYDPDGGIGFIDGVIVDSHFSERGREGRLIRLLADTRDGRLGTERGIGVDEGTALVIYNVGQTGSYGEVVGSQGVFLADLSRATVGSSGPIGQYWAIDTVDTSYLTENDQVAMDSWDVTFASWKSNMKGQEYYDNAATSSKIFNGNRDNPSKLAEYTYVATDLFDSRLSTQTYGTTTEAGPRFRVDFVESERSVGYGGRHPITNRFDIAYEDLVVDMFVRMQTIDVCKKDAGKLWYRKATPLEDGLILKITNTVSSALDSSRNVRFLHTAFDVTGDSFVAGDYQGNIYKFDLHRNRFQLLRKTGSPSTCLAFSLRRKSEFLAALADYSLRCYDTETKEEVAVMKGHGSVIQNVSIHTSGRYALTSSQDEAQLWDLDTFQRKRKLNIKENVGIVNVFFIPLSNTILTCFKDNSIFAWEADTLTCKYQLTVPEGKPANFKALTASRDGRLLVTGGKSRFLHVWALDTRKLLRIVELPSKITTVKQLAFLTGSFDNGSNETLGVLGQDGIMRFINITTCKLVFDVGSLDDRINNVSVSSTGRHIVAVMDSGNVNVYSVAALTQELNRPPPPLVKIVKSNKMADHTCDTTDSKTSTKHTKEKVNSHMQWSADTSTETPLPDGLSLPRLLSILRGYGEYPAKYRMFIWRSVLRLPENVAAFAALADKGTHPAFDSLHTQYPIKSRKLLRVLQRVLSALGHWSPIFGETNYLPMLAFPFVKLFQNNQLVCFEIVATVLENWCQHWFEYFPNPPINILGVVENVLAHHDKELLTHYVRYGVTSQIYAWPVLQTLFSEVLTRDEWLRLFDNVFSNDPSFLLMVAVAYSITNRGPLLKCTELDDFKFFFHHRNAVDVQQIINETYRLMNTTPDDIHPQEVLEDFVPLTRGQYPVFNKYPKFIVDYQVQERERIRTEELEYLRQRELSLELQKETEKRLAEEEAWYRQQALLLAAEEKRRHLITDEEQKLADQRTRLTALNREVKMKEMQLLDATRRKFLQFQQMQKETELTRMDDEIRRKALLRDTETEAAMDAADVKSAELTIQRKLLEQEMWRDNADMAHREALDQHTHRLMQEIPMRLNTNNSHADRNMSQQRDIYEKLAKTDNILANISLRKDMELRNREDYEEKDRKLAQLARLDAENERIASQVQQLGASVVKRKENEVSRLSHEKDFDSPKPQPNKPGTLSAQKIVNDLAETQRAMFERIREIRQGVQSSGSPPQHPGGRQHTDRAYLNDTTSTEASTQLSLDRGRDEFEARERELMDGVRRMREKMAQRSRSNKPPTKYQQMA